MKHPPGPPMTLGNMRQPRLTLATRDTSGSLG